MFARLRSAAQTPPRSGNRRCSAGFHLLPPPPPASRQVRHVPAASGPLIASRPASLLPASPLARPRREGGGWSLAARGRPSPHPADSVSRRCAVRAGVRALAAVREAAVGRRVLPGADGVVEGDAPAGR